MVPEGAKIKNRYDALCAIPASDGLEDCEMEKQVADDRESTGNAPRFQAASRLKNRDIDKLTKKPWMASSSAWMDRYA